MKLSANWVKVAVPIEKEDIGFYLDKRFDPYAFATSSGVIVDICSELRYSDVKFGREAMLEYDSPIEMQIGDTAYFNYLSAQRAEETGRSYTEGDYQYLIIRYDRFYGVWRNGTWHGVNGWKVMLPMTAVVDGFIPVPVLSGEVLGTGATVKHYWDKKYQELGGVNNGDILTFMAGNPIDNVISDLNLLKCQERDILTINDKPFHDCVEIELTENSVISSLENPDEKIMTGIVICAGEKLSSLIGQEITFLKDIVFGIGGKWYVKRIQDVISYKKRNLIVSV